MDITAPSQGAVAGSIPAGIAILSFAETDKFTVKMCIDFFPSFYNSNIS